MPDQFDVFLSHNSRDKPVVEEIATWLRDRGLRVWLDKDELRPGFPWQEGLEEGVQTSRSVAVFVGKDGLGPWQKPEMRAFLARSRQEEIPVIPVLLPGCPGFPRLTLFLEGLTWVDLRQGLTDDGLALLVWGITGAKGERTEVVPAADRGTSERPGRSNQRKIPKAWWNWGIAFSLLSVLLTLAAWFWPRSPEPPLPPPRPAIYAVRVQVLNPQGLPIAGSTIRVSTNNEPQGTPDGWWEIEIPAAKVPANGRIALWAEHPEWRENRKDLRLGTDPNVQVEIRLKEPESPPPATRQDDASGVATRETTSLPTKPAVYAIRVQVLDPQGRPVGESKVSASAGIEPQQLPNGWWEVEVPSVKVPADGRISLWAEHAEWEGDRVDLRLDKDPNPRAEIHLKEPETWLRGQVVDESGRALSGVQVSRQGGAPGEAITDAQGRFALKLSVPRNTLVRLLAMHEGGEFREVYCYAGRDSCAITLEVM